MSFSVHLISTPCGFSHEYESPLFNIRQIPTNMGDQKHFGHPGPFEHHFYALQIGDPEYDTSTFRIWDTEVNSIVSLLSVWFGKRIKNHGNLFLHSEWCLPDFSELSPNSYFSLPLFGKPHNQTPLNKCDWSTLNDLETLFNIVMKSGNDHPFLNAAKSYAEALNYLPFDLELAYLRLIQSVECVAISVQYSDEDRFSHDEQLNEALNWLESMEDGKGKQVAQLIKSRLYQVSRGVFLWLSSRIDSSFFNNQNNVLTKEKLKTAISAAYALRSKYIHNGLRFGEWIDPSEGRCGSSDMVPEYFQDMCKDNNLKKILARCPSLMGLERLVRFALVKEINNVTRA